MIRLKNIFTVALFCLTIVSCGQTKNEQQKPKQKIEHKYHKVISDSTNRLSGKIENIEVKYIVWGCACPQWIKTKDLEIKDTTVEFFDKHFYIEPVDNTLKYPIYFDLFRHNIMLQGQFYQRKDYPQGTIELEEPMPKAKVFRYTKIEVIQKGQKQNGR